MTLILFAASLPLTIRNIRPQTHRRVHPFSAPKHCSRCTVLCQTLSSTSAEPSLHSTLLPENTIQQESLDLLEWPAITAQVLRHASTPCGKAVLAPNGGLHIPTSQTASEALLAQTRELQTLEEIHSSPLRFAGLEEDITTQLTRVAKGGTLHGKQLISVANLLESARRIRRQIDAVPDIPILSDLVASFRTWPEVEREITRCLDEFGDVTESADPPLRAIRQSIRETLSEIRAKLNQIMATHSEAIQERVITTRYERFVIPVKMSRKAEFRRGIVHDASSTGSTAFIEPSSVRALNDQMRSLVAKEKARVQAILRRLSAEIVAPIVPDLQNLTSVLATLDAAAARSRASKELRGSDVYFDNEAPVRLVGARHPVLSWKAMEANSNEDTDKVDDDTKPQWMHNVVPSSYILSPDVRCVCVTGPNTGGKTLSLKTLGVSVLMAKAGLFVPASVSTLPELGDEPETGRARLPYFDKVLADIGDDQSLVQSLSTFSGHIERVKKILSESTSQSLVLLDEIGSGTDPAEGAALGMAIVRHLAINNKAALTFCTTHHGELKTLKYGGDDWARYFENASVEFDDVRMAPTFKLVWGIPGRSNALAIANRLGLERSVVDEAKYLLTGADEDGSRSSSRVDIEKMIQSLEGERIAAECAREDAERALQDVQRLRSDLQERLERMRASEKTLRENQKVAMDSELKAAKKQIAKVIRDMQEGGGSAQAAGKASDKLVRINLPGSLPKDKMSAMNLAGDQTAIDVGDKVIVARFGTSPLEVVELVSKKECVVAVGSMKAKVKMREIISVTKAQRSVQETMDRSAVVASSNERKEAMMVQTAANTIDIRGQRVDTAQANVDKAIDKALALGTIWIIHGHGSGRLRSAIRQFLSNHELVDRIEYAQQSEGGTGVTVAFLA